MVFVELSQVEVEALVVEAGTELAVYSEVFRPRWWR